ncbi:MAG: hypothetical protein WBF06_11500 [Candidatus Acidiferrales bacterium]
MCLLLASWVDAAVIFVLLPLIFFRWYLDLAVRGSRATVGGISSSGQRNISPSFISKTKSFLHHDSGIAALLVLLSFAASYAWSGIVSIAAADGDWPYPPVQPWRLPEVWFQFAKSVWSEYLVGSWGIAVASLLALGVLVRLFARGKIRGTNPPAAILITSALVSFLLMGSLSHIQNTEFDPRFALQSMVLLQVGAVAWALLPLYSLLRLSARRALMATAMILFLCTPLYLYGRPSLAKVRADLDQTLGQHTPAILQSGATHILGDYWMVWPATFHVNWTLYEMGSERKVWGVTDRSTPTRIFWSQIPPDKMRLATVAGDPSVPYVQNMYSFPPLTRDQQFNEIIILTPAPNSEVPNQ